MPAFSGFSENYFMDKLNVCTQLRKPFLTENFNSVGQSMVLIMLRLWVQPLYGPSTQDLDLRLFTGPLQLGFSQNHRIFIALVSEDFKIISGKFWCFKQENSIPLPPFSLSCSCLKHFYFLNIICLLCPFHHNFFTEELLWQTGECLGDLGEVAFFTLTGLFCLPWVVVKLRPEMSG